MKKTYKKPNVELFPTRCHVSSLSPNEPEELNSSRRSLLMRAGLIITVGHITLYGASGNNGNGNGSGSNNGNAGGNGNGNGIPGGWK